jgi:hypothetical protein
MKSLFLSILVILYVITGFSQVSYGLTGSLNLANQKIKASEGGLTVARNGSSIVSFQVGGFADITLSKNISFAPELMLSGEGCNIPGNDPNTGESITLNFRAYYLRIPLNLLFETELRGNAKFFIGAGPDFGFGLFGKSSVGFSSTNTFQDSLFKRFDLGLNLIAGVELAAGVRLSLNYDLGLSSIVGSTFSSLVGNASGGETIHWYNRVISFSVGYIINKK